MRLIAVADTHNHQDEQGFALPDGDWLVHAGDLTRGGTLEELAIAVNWLRGQKHRIKIVVAGNHDWCFQRQPLEARKMLADAGICYLEDSGETIEGLQVWGSPWQPEYNQWAFNLPRGQLGEKWRQIPSGIDLLITHGPPADCGDRSGNSARAGCAELRDERRRIRPRLHLCGHIHQDGGYWGTPDGIVVNCTTWECERAATVLELNAKGISPVTIPPALVPSLMQAQESLRAAHKEPGVHD